MTPEWTPEEDLPADFEFGDDDPEDAADATE